MTKPMKCDDPEVAPYVRRFAKQKLWDTVSWRGVPMVKAPTDVLVYQEILHLRQPEAIVEVGTKYGGTALFLADVSGLSSTPAEIVTVDQLDRSRVEHPRIHKIIGKSLNPAIAAQVAKRCQGKRTMVILDSDHNAGHVSQELSLYGPIVTPGQYLIVEDTLIDFVLDAVPRFRTNYPQGGPLPAVQRFLKQHPEFSADPQCERFGLTTNPSGYLFKKQK